MSWRPTSSATPRRSTRTSWRPASGCAGAYKPGDTIGKTGVELSFENDLRGQPGIEELEVDAAGRVLRTLNSRPPVPGYDVKLTIDVNVQTHGRGRRWREGLAVAREARDQRVQEALPRARPARPSCSTRATARCWPWRRTRRTTRRSTSTGRSRSSSACRTPRSTRRSTTAPARASTRPARPSSSSPSIAALSKGLISPNTTVDDKGSIKIGNQVFRNAGSAPHGRVRLDRALTVSSDVFYYSPGRPVLERARPLRRDGHPGHRARSRPR